MKKLGFVLALVFVGCIAMAQHISQVTETGNGNNATVNQSFLGSGTAFQGNESYITQIGDKNIADVDQVNNGYAGQAMRSDISSIGDENYAKVNQNLEGQGDAIIDQLGNNNSASIFQTGNFGAASPLDGTHDASVTQTGDDNSVVMNIYGTDATGFVWQLGDNNKVTQDLGQTVGDKVQNSNFLVKQQGNNNQAYQYMEGEGFAGGITTQFNNGWISQFGDNNWAEQKMLTNTGDLSSPTNDYEYLEQYGNNNTSSQIQAGQVNLSSVIQGKNLPLIGGNSSTTNQTGNFNTAYVIQN